MKSTIKNIPINELDIHPTPGCQRAEGVSQRWVDDRVPAFNDSKLGVLTVVERDGQYQVVDGAHRLTLCRKVGHTWPLRCEVFTSTSLAEDAAIFGGRNDFRRPSTLTRFYSRVLEGDQTANDIKRIVTDAGWQFGNPTDDGRMAAVEALEMVYRTGSGVLPKGEYPELLERVIRTLTIAWAWDHKSADGNIIKGLGQLFGRFGESIDEPKLVSEMQNMPPGVLVGRAKGLRDAQGGKLPAALAKILVIAHNSKRRKNLLPEWVWVR